MARDIRSEVIASLLSSVFFKRDEPWSEGPEAVIARALERQSLVPLSHIASVFGNDPGRCADEILEKCHALAVCLVTIWDSAYPELLKNIPQPPAVLYCRGSAVFPDRTIAIVGSRKADDPSLVTARRVAAESAERNVTVVSGMAYGIDSAAHHGALDAGGSTIAVMGTGIDQIYPAGNRNLAARILKQRESSIVSELPPGIPAQSWTFIRRNRIISGLARATLVVQAGEKSGALGTAKYALDQGREVYCATGYPFDEAYFGSLRLIDEGARPFISTEGLLMGAGIITDCGMAPNNQMELFRDDTGERGAVNVDTEVLDCCRGAGNTIDGIAERCGLGINEINQRVTELELLGRIARKNGRLYALTGAVR